MPFVILLHYYFVQLFGAKGGDSCGNARNVRRNKPRVSEGYGLRCARGKQRPPAFITIKVLKAQWLVAKIHHTPKIPRTFLPIQLKYA